MSLILPYQLLHGPYPAPALVIGEETTCLLRGCTVRITSWTEAPIPWPRCQAIDQRGGSGLLLNDELARAVRCEAVMAIRHWWGVSGGIVCRWRKVLGVGRWQGQEATMGQNPGALILPRWTDGELALLGIMSDEEVAAAIGKPVNAVQVKRSRLGIPKTHDRRRRRGTQP